MYGTPRGGWYPGVLDTILAGLFLLRLPSTGGGRHSRWTAVRRTGVLHQSGVGTNIVAGIAESGVAARVAFACPDGTSTRGLAVPADVVALVPRLWAVIGGRRRGAGGQAAAVRPTAVCAETAADRERVARAHLEAGGQDRRCVRHLDTGRHHCPPRGSGLLLFGHFEFMRHGVFSFLSFRSDCCGRDGIRRPRRTTLVNPTSPLRLLPQPNGRASVARTQKWALA